MGWMASHGGATACVCTAAGHHPCTHVEYIRRAFKNVQLYFDRHQRLSGQGQCGLGPLEALLKLFKLTRPFLIRLGELATLPFVLLLKVGPELFARGAAILGAPLLPRHL